ncbi:MAG: M6 family metalloprotease domain-containing protein, partial [Spirochaetaceae bacterium]|nr:M6 family metalloprotease domain-containing protein [Spirochaetaceae bacterium]
NPKNKSGYIIPALLLIFLIVQILFKARKRYILLTAYLLVISSCFDNDSAKINPGDPLHFQTNDIINVFKNVLGASDAKNPVPLTMKKYWEDMSNGKLILNFDIVGPFRVSKGWQYYGRNKSSGADSYPAQFVGEAVKLAIASKEVKDFSIYDNNKDGYVDSVIIVHAGQGEEFWGVSKDAIWSHSWDLNSAKISGDGGGAIRVDGVWINRYTIQPEYNYDPGDASIGVFCHEFAHVLGLPDLYDTSEETFGIGYWSLMSHGSWGDNGTGEDPAPLLAWERAFLGTDWITIRPYNKTTVTETIPNILDIEAGKTAYKIPLDTNNANNATQYLLLERKTQAFGVGKKFVPASGILITHINENIITKYWRTPVPLSNANKVNAGRNRVHGVNIVESNGTGLGGKGLLWDRPNLNYVMSSSANMIFLSTLGSQRVYRPTPTSATTAPDSAYYPNSNYHTEEIAISKTGYSGIELLLKASDYSIEINYVPYP